MAFKRNIVNYDLGRVFELVVNTKTLRLSLEGTGEADFKEAYRTFDELETAYRKRIVPYLKKHDCYDIDRACRVDARQPLRELLDVEGVEPARPRKRAKDPIDRLVAAASQVLRKRLNAAIGLQRCKLESAVFLLHDAGIRGVVINLPALRGVSEEKLAEVIQTDGWCDGDFRKAAAWDLETNPLGGPALEAFGDPYNVYDHCFRQLMHLACAQVEAEPNLRDNIKVMPGFRVLIGESEEPSPDLQLRAVARAHLGTPAAKFFEATRGE
jgi:hypothetical protein